MSVVLDASALLAMLLNEPGTGEVVAVMRGSAMSAVNASECFSRAIDKGFSAALPLAMLHEFEIEIVPFGLHQAEIAADLRTATRSIGASLGDRACLALAQERRLPVYTSDRRLAELDIGIDIRLIR